mgnify:CR=1 FL=1
MHDLYKIVKQKTGFKETWFAKVLGISRQGLNLWFKNYSTLYKNAQANVLNTAIDLKIEELEEQIKELKAIKTKVKEETLKNGE